ncbi:MAG: hypothetical protein ABI467_03045 [Kofleriaceae bacterium]
MKILASLCFVLGTACSSYSPDLGQVPFACGMSDPKCPDGYDCVPLGGAGQMVCARAGGTAPDGGDNGQCADDSNLEPNNDVAHAYMINSLPAGGLKLAGLSICPAGDKDTYELAAAQGQTLEADIDFDPSQAALTVNLISSSGVTTAPGQPNGSGKAKAALVGTQSGMQYVQVLVSPTAGSMTTNGNYKLTLTLM